MTTELVTLDEIKEMAKISFASSLFSMPNEESMATLMMLCQSEGIHPLQALKRYHIIKGRPSMRADAMQAEFQRAGGKVEWVERSDKKCEATFTHEQGGSVTVDWTIDMAKKAGLLSNPTWTKYPRQMLTARVISEGVRTVYPAIVTGIYTPDEIENFDTKPIEKKADDVSDAVIVDNPKAPPAQRLKEIPGEEIAEKIKTARKMLKDVGCKTLSDFNPLVSTLIERELAEKENLHSLSTKELDTLINKLDVQLSGG